jgi:hypothetical protein
MAARSFKGDDAEPNPRTPRQMVDVAVYHSPRRIFHRRLSFGLDKSDPVSVEISAVVERGSRCLRYAPLVTGSGT